MEIDNVFQDIGESGPQQIKYGVLLCLVKEGLTLTLNAQICEVFAFKKQIYVSILDTSKNHPNENWSLLRVRPGPDVPPPAHAAVHLRGAGHRVQLHPRLLPGPRHGGDEQLVSAQQVTTGARWGTTSAANRSIGSTTGFHNHGEGPY